ncbi:hypothetical protein H5410_004200 [Solanum commersonii]|uniref:Uncharacterized protein n=1 Tax=Solanum commersonii TaxID=4109 RepID=A0A9J6B7A3_SOLCO|nr:hypothetical protein H5410_004200 [Solanum commersonii]
MEGKHDNSRVVLLAVHWNPEVERQAIIEPTGMARKNCSCLLSSDIEMEMYFIPEMKRIFHVLCQRRTYLNPWLSMRASVLFLKTISCTSCKAYFML